MWTLLGVNWVIEGRWREKWQLARASRLLQALWVLLIAFAVSSLRSSTLALGIDELRVLLPLMVVGTVTLTTPAVTGRDRAIVLWLFSATVTVVSVVSAIRLFTIPDLPYRDAVPFISHIRFCLCCCMVLWVACIEPLPWRVRGVDVVLRVVLALWMVVFIFLMRSYTAVAVLGVSTAVVMATVPGYRKLLWVWCAVALAAVAVVGYECYTYYTPSSLERLPLRTATVNGNPYRHKPNSAIECGNSVEHYVCHKELAEQWPRRSSLSISSYEANGFHVESTLIRYLNALGLTKDSAGVAQLTDEQVREVERGIENPVVYHGNLLKKMVDPLLYEWEKYRRYGVFDGSSVLQRVALWRTTLNIIAQHPWFGVPMGDLLAYLEAEHVRTHSPLAGRNMLPHNQYLTLVAIFGFPLFCFVVIVFLRAIPALRRQNPFMIAWTVAVLLSFLTENTLATNAGLLFCTFFLAFRQPD